MAGDVNKSGYRVPLVEHTLPTIMTSSRMFHFGMNMRMDGYTLMASRAYVRFMSEVFCMVDDS